MSAQLHIHPAYLANQLEATRLDLADLQARFDYLEQDHNAMKARTEKLEEKHRVTFDGLNDAWRTLLDRPHEEPEPAEALPERNTRNILWLLAGWQGVQTLALVAYLLAR